MGRSRMSIVKRQREVKKAEKAASKRAKRHGTPEIAFTEPQPTVRISNLGLHTDPDEDSEKTQESEEAEPARG